MNGKKVLEIAQRTFGKQKITKEELNYVLTRMQVSSYLLKYHTIKNRPITFHVSGRDQERAQGHRPWQVGIINDEHPDKVVIKSRQLGLSEMGVGEMIHFADVHSYAGVKCLYTFPKLFWGVI